MILSFSGRISTDHKSLVKVPRNACDLISAEVARASSSSNF